MLMLPLLASLALAGTEPAPVEAAPVAAEAVPDHGAVPAAGAAPADGASPEGDEEALPPLPEDPAELRAAVAARLTEGGVPPEELERITEAVASQIELERSLTPREGEIELGEGLATLHLAEGYRFLGSSDAVKVLVQWGNPPPPEPPLGLVYEAEAGLFGETSWAMFVEYSAEGHVDDADAASIDYDALLADIQEGQRQANEARTAAGYEPLEVRGWAEPPHYDSASKKLYWAKHIASPSGDTLNYDIRVLGRRGVLSLSAVAGMGQLDQVRSGMEALLPQVEFKSGERYADFDPSVDQVAAVGIAALIGGKVAAKAGFFKLLIAGLFASKKLVVAGVVGLLAVLRGFFGRKSE